MGFSESIIDISSQRMQRRSAFFEMFCTSHFSSSQAAGYLYLDALGTHTHSRSDSGLDGFAVRNTTFQLTGDRIRNEYGIQFRAFDFRNADLDFLSCEFLQFFLQFVHFLTCLTDNQSWPSREDSNSDHLQCTFNQNLGNVCLCQTSIQVFADFIIFHQLGFETASAIPTGIPSSDDS